MLSGFCAERRAKRANEHEQASEHRTVCALLLLHARVSDQISVHIVELMHAPDRERRLSNVESRLFLRENIVFHQDGHQVTTGQIFHHKVEILVVLEGVVKLHDPRIVWGEQGQERKPANEQSCTHKQHDVVS